MDEHNKKVIAEFRSTRDDPNGPYKNRPMLLLTTTGAKSGQQRTVPIMYVRDGEQLLVIASNAGAEHHPDWYHNLTANPQVTVEVGGEEFAATAVVTEGVEHERVWKLITGQYPFFSEHQQKTKRQIPVVALERNSD